MASAQLPVKTSTMLLSALLDEVTIETPKLLQLSLTPSGSKSNLLIFSPASSE